MSRRVWLLVEWVEEKKDNVLPNYGIADAMINRENDIKPGQTIHIQTKKVARPRKALILKISDDKRQIKEHKIFLQRQDNQVQNVLSLCMRTIKEIKQEPLVLSPFDNRSQTIFGAGTSSAPTPQITADLESDSSNSDDESSGNSSDDKGSEVKTNDRSTQTDLPYDQPSMSPSHRLRLIKDMEEELNELYKKFLISASPNDDELNLSEETVQNTDGPAVETEAHKLTTPKALEVRRVSAHTTNNFDFQPFNDDMIPIGKGNVLIPQRLVSEINWGSYTSATRQLLQAVFPRKVLATHSLTGKKSPAFMNKPPKKRLDPKMIEDIIVTVANRCGVSNSMVRNAISVKCTDEAKLYRVRQQNRLQALQNRRVNQENLSQSPPSSVEAQPAQ